jgi:hypothetical protein
MFNKKTHICDVIITPTIHDKDVLVVEKHRGDNVVDVAIFPRENVLSKRDYLNTIKDKPYELHEVKSNLTAGDINKYLTSHRFTALHKPLSAGLYETLVCIDRDIVMIALREHTKLKKSFYG